MSRNFSNGKIYKISNDYNDDIYVGSTCDTLVKRFIKHKSKSKTERTKLYNFINEIGFNRFRIELIEVYPCEDKYQLRQKEDFWIRQIATLNSRGSSPLPIDEILNKQSEYNKQYYIENEEKIKDYKRNLYQKNKEKIVCECGCKISKNYLNKHIKNKKHLDKMIYS